MKFEHPFKKLYFSKNSIILIAIKYNSKLHMLMENYFEILKFFILSWGLLLFTSACNLKEFLIYPKRIFVGGGVVRKRQYMLCTRNCGRS